MSELKVGIVGAVGRGRSLRHGWEAAGARITAVCDLNADALDEAREQLGAEQAFTDYETMLDRAHVDAVVVGTPMPLHVPQSVAALERGVHVLSEVPAGVSVEESRDLVRAADASDAVYMMGENYCYTRPNMTLQRMAAQGLFGEIYYAQGEYLHDVRDYITRTPWRRHWQMGIDGVTYCTHSLGPILACLPGDRVVRVCCEAAGSHFTDPDGEPLHRDSPVMLCRTANDVLIVLRVDLTSPRPHAMTNYQLQGTDGCYESSRWGLAERNKVWLRSLSEKEQWLDFDSITVAGELAERFVPEGWRNPPEGARHAGHGGGDYFQTLDFVRACRGEAPCPIDVHRAMDITLPGLVSQQSIQRGGAWIDVPDSRKWTGEPAQPQLHMVLDPSVLDNPPEVRLKSGYEMRTYRDGDAEEFIALHHKAGFANWSEDILNWCLEHALPDGIFIATHKGKMVATAMATHHPTKEHPAGGELGWVSGDPEHAGRGLGRAVCAAVIRRYAQAGYHHVYLSTDDWRLPAISVYLKLGFRPHLYKEGMAERWDAVRAKLAAGRD